ncbi:ribonuclease E/G [soil metagenome]
MSRRAIFLDCAIGEDRALVTLDGRPERLLLERGVDQTAQRLGQGSVARVRRIERGLGTAFLELLDGPDAAAPMGELVEGRFVEIVVTAEARHGKGPVARVAANADGPLRLTIAGQAVLERIQQFAPDTELIIGQDARRAIDAAQDAVLEVVHPLPGGGQISIEPTRALTAVDVDLGAKGGSDQRRAARQVNLTAIAQGARLLRLKGLGGLVVFDLVGKGHDGVAISAAAKAAFAPDGAGVSIGPISRFGLFELSLPRTVRPLAEVVVDETGMVTPLTAALALLRRVEDEAAAHPGARLDIRAAPDVAEAVAPYMVEVHHRFGPRVRLEVDPARVRTAFEVIAE